MTARPPQVAARVLAALLVLASSGMPVAAQQQPAERKFVPSPLKLFSRAIEGIRRANKPPEAAKAEGNRARERPRPRMARAESAAAPPMIARLPRPRPTGPTTPPNEPTEASGSLFSSSEAPSSLAAAQSLASEQQASAAEDAASLIDMPATFAAAGVDPAPRTLGLPAGPAPWHADAAGLVDEEPSVLGRVADVLPVESAPTAPAALESLARPPRARPQEPSAVLAMVDPRTAPAPAETPAGPPPPPLAPVALSADETACRARLRSLGVAFVESDPIDSEEGCDVPAPLTVTSLGSGVALTPEALLNCRTAEALALWVRDSVVPTARTVLQDSPKEIVHASTYVCRPRNNQEGSKLSEHATANAVDISAIGFADRAPIDIKERDAALPEEKFSAAIRADSCAYFTTVLGPGSNSAHATHLHFDLAQRRGGYRLCELGPPSTAEAPAANTNRE